MKPRSLLRLVGAIVVAALPAAGHAVPSECEVPADLMEVSAKLPHLAERLRTRQPVTIVAIGGASTKGGAAGALDLAYPHRLQLALAAEYPDVPVKVINKGVPRQSTQQMIERFPADVFDEHPVLVVWEAGITDAVRGVEVDNFAAALQSGIDAVKNRSIDIVLVDLQFSRKAATLIDFELYLRAIQRVGELNNVYVFPRFEIMRYWSEQHMFNFDEVSDKERPLLAANAYACLARQLAQALRLAAE